ncbi:substrate-binding periplasmic protein [Litoribrevibacter euphylliae]|uniref:Substrate-binding periplasmic protein n=1 Tax=Litoribrevibacter euphylliae TaxID=1834034 RepID=A0ABV7HJM2_9GAMM
MLWHPLQSVVARQWMVVTIFFVVLCLLQPRNLEASQVIHVPVYQYHNWEPFYFKDNKGHQGFSVVFVEQLNDFFRKQRPDLKIHFTLKPMDRPDLNALLKEGRQGLVLWANELWFKRLFDRPYFSATSPIYWDNDAIISLAKTPVEYVEPKSLVGLHLGGLKGHYYHGVDQLVSLGKIKRTDVDNDRINLQRLLDGKINAMVITQTVFNYAKPDYPDSIFYQSFVPQDTYSRHILMTPGYSHLSELLNFYISSLPHNEEWTDVLTAYGLDDLIVPFTLDLNELNNFSIEE